MIKSVVSLNNDSSKKNTNSIVKINYKCKSKRTKYYDPDLDVDGVDGVDGVVDDLDLDDSGGGVVCGGGDFLEYFKSDFECWGVEIDGEGVKNARKKISKNILSGTLIKSTIEKEFDLIIFRGTIEHIPEAKETLVKAIKLLRSGASSFIYITSTPNIECISAEIFRTNWTQHMPEEHIYHFRKKHFDDLFKKYGLKNVAEWYFYEETPYANVEEDIKLVAKGIKLRQKGEPINFKSPPFYGNMMSLIYCGNRL